MVVVTFGLQVTSQHNAVLGRVLKTSTIPLGDCVRPLAIGAIPLLSQEMVKVVRRRRQREGSRERMVPAA